MRNRRGFSLIELMVAMAIGLLVVLALTIVIARASSSQRELALANRQLENGRFAMQAIADDLHNAGYVGPIANLPAVTGIPDLCQTGAGSATEYAKAIGIGAFPLVAVPSSCINPADHVAGTDILAIVHASSLPTTATVGTLRAGVPYIQTDTRQVRLAIGGSTTFDLKKKDGTTPAEIRQLQVYIYYVSPCNRPVPVGGNCSAAADDGRPVPTLRKMVLAGNPLAITFETRAVAEGIEDLQVELGLDSTGNDGGPDSYKRITANPTQQDLVDATAVGVHLLARNTEPTLGYTDVGKSYMLGTTTVGARNDAFRRHVFSRVIRLHNASGRRAS